MTGIESGKAWSRIGPQVAPSADGAGGVWGNLNEVAEYIGASQWPIPLGPSWEAIATVTETGTTNAITFASIPQTYSDLKIVFVGTCDSDNHYNEFKFNGNTSGSAYNNFLFQGYYSSVGYGPTVYETSLGSEWFPPTQFPRATTDDMLSSMIIDIPNYSSTTLFKAAKSIGSQRDTVSFTGAQSEGGPFFGYYCAEETAGLTQIEMDSYSNNWSNFTVTLYGLSS